MGGLYCQESTFFNHPPQSRDPILPIGHCFPTIWRACPWVPMGPRGTHPERLKHVPEWVSHPPPGHAHPMGVPRPALFQQHSFEHSTKLGLAAMAADGARTGRRTARGVCGVRMFKRKSPETSMRPRQITRQIRRKSQWNPSTGLFPRASSFKTMHAKWERPGSHLPPAQHLSTC